MKKDLTLPLICSSLVFFFIIGMFLVSLIRLLAELFGIIPALFGIVSLAGTLLILRESYSSSKVWFLGIPHVIVLVAICVIGPAFLILGKHLLIEYVFIPTALLSLTSIGFFISYLNPQEKTAQIFMVLSGIIGLFAIFSIYHAVLGIMNPLRTSWNVVALLEGIYWYLMPIIGLCIIMSAFHLRELPE